jgi:hypothetical protein
LFIRPSELLHSSMIIGALGIEAGARTIEVKVCSSVFDQMDKKRKRRILGIW